MRLGVLGTGTVGQALASKLVELGHEVRMGSRRAGNEKAAEWASASGERASEGDFADAAGFGEAVVNATAGAASLEALRAAGAPVTAVDILPDPAIRRELSALSGWPTIPQVFVKGELIGGADIVEELAQTGELRAKLESALGPDYATGDDRVVDVLARA